jgi:hypothetical protein
MQPRTGIRIFLCKRFILLISISPMAAKTNPKITSIIPREVGGMVYGFVIPIIITVLR